MTNPRTPKPSDTNKAKGKAAAAYARRFLERSATYMQLERLPAKDITPEMRAVDDEISLRRAGRFSLEGSIKELYREPDAALDPIFLIKKVVKLFKEENPLKAGNCDEFANFVANYFEAHPIDATVEIIEAIGVDHVVVLIGRAQQYHIDETHKWGEKAVVVDAWSKEKDVYRGTPAKLQKYFYHENPDFNYARDVKKFRVLRVINKAESVEVKKEKVNQAYESTYRKLLDIERAVNATQEESPDFIFDFDALDQDRQTVQTRKGETYQDPSANIYRKLCKIIFKQIKTALKENHGDTDLFLRNLFAIWVRKRLAHADETNEFDFKFIFDILMHHDSRVAIAVLDGLIQHKKIALINKVATRYVDYQTIISVAIHRQDNALLLKLLPCLTARTIAYVNDVFIQYASSNGLLTHVIKNNMHTQVLAHLINKGIDVNTYPPDQTPPLIHAARKNNEMVKLLLLKGANVNALGKNNISALHAAVQHNHVDIVLTLINNNANINALCLPLGKTPLHLAAEANNYMMVEFLLMKGADPTIKTQDGKLAADLTNDYLIIKTLEVGTILFLEKNKTAAPIEPQHSHRSR